MYWKWLNSNNECIDLRLIRFLKSKKYQTIGFVFGGLTLLSLGYDLYLTNEVEWMIGKTMILHDRDVAEYLFELLSAIQLTACMHVLYIMVK